ncbi:unnamed protein product [Eruca vesicaria subsp. sativa]|uniref:GH3 C-terminal domain-containing protein n=1 Tax=Eruca vesicaria subsp. sativa TaxID=29727 RepID=A0ABC8JKE5_ERUVS|nr:unnamed protein product [Eruca vesicaria subsp. sativa]
MEFYYTRPESTTPSGLPVASSFSTFFKSDYFKNRPSNSKSTSPNQVIMCPDNSQILYCHVLCGLSQKDEVVRAVATFAHALVQALSCLERNWKELSSVSVIIGGPNPKLADLIEQECSHNSWESIIPRLWPNTKFIECILTGQDLSYTFVPNMSFFEFLPVDHRGDMTSIVDLVNVKLGCYYEPVVTTYFGLNRYLIGDIVYVTGFYNNTPQFRFVRRKNVVLNVDQETTTEEEILRGLITHAAFVHNQSSNVMLIDFTCNTDISTSPGHYVFYLELKAKDVNEAVELDENVQVLVECCSVIEESFGDVYRSLRTSGSVGALEIRVVQQGTFDTLMDYIISRGGSTNQYKTLICIKSSEAVVILENSVLVRFHSEKYPLFGT